MHVRVQREELHKEARGGTEVKVYKVTVRPAMMLKMLR